MAAAAASGFASAAGGVAGSNGGGNGANQSSHSNSPSGLPYATSSLTNIVSQPPRSKGLMNGKKKNAISFLDMAKGII